MIKEKYKQLCLSCRIGGIYTIAFTQSLAAIRYDIENSITWCNIFCNLIFKNKKLNLIIYTSLFALLLLMGASCTPDYSVNKNIVEYDKTKFIVLSPTLIAIQTEDCSNRKIDYRDNDIEFKVSKYDQKLLIET